MDRLLNDNQGTAILKITVAWMGAVVGSITLSQIVLFLTAIFTVLQIWKLIHELRKERRRDRFEELLRKKDDE